MLHDPAAGCRLGAATNVLGPGRIGGVIMGTALYRSGTPRPSMWRSFRVGKIYVDASEAVCQRDVVLLA